jgi:hypothetical protein
MSADIGEITKIPDIIAPYSPLIAPRHYQRLAFSLCFVGLSIMAWFFM